MSNHWKSSRQKTIEKDSQARPVGLIEDDKPIEELFG